MSYPFLKGHGTENDFVLLPDHDGAVHGDLPAARVVALCDRRTGIGGDGVLRVIRSAAIGGLADAEWFMDYRNADGSVAEMCGNGIRVFARYLVDAGLADAAAPLRIGTRDGVKTVTVDGELVTVDLGAPVVAGETKVAVGGRALRAVHVEIGNPHAVVFVDDLAEAGPLLDPPDHDAGAYPAGVNVEFVVRRGPGRLAMRVHERGSGETRSCGTGACAVAAAAARVDRAESGAAYQVEVRGGRLGVVLTREGRALLTGPAVIVARGATAL